MPSQSFTSQNFEGCGQPCELMQLRT